MRMSQRLPEGDALEPRSLLGLLCLLFSSCSFFRNSRNAIMPILRIILSSASNSHLLMFTHLLSAFAPSALSWEHENTSSSQPRPLPKGDGSAQIASSALFQETVV